MDVVALEQALSSLGLRDARRIVGGRQSLAVYAAQVDGRHVVVKLLESAVVDRDDLAVRVEVLSRLGAISDMVCTPVPIDGHLISQIAADGVDAVHAVAYQFADGVAPDVDQPDDAWQMGRVLAELHAAMAELRPCGLPGLAAFPPPTELETVAADLGVPTAWLRDEGSRPQQLLHGDFSSTNLRVANATWRIFDFDDCGYGPVELELANSLYFVLFDAMTGRRRDHYRRFRERLLGGYQDGAGTAPPGAALDALITRRILALAAWLADAATAPPGIRNASDHWHKTLGTFVQHYVATIRDPG